MTGTGKKIIAGLILFGSGLIVGFFGARLFHERGTIALLHDHARFAEMALRHLRVELDLSDAQVQQIRPIMTETATKIAEIRREQEPKIQEVLDKDIAAIKKILTPGQAELFDATIKRLRERRQALERFGPPPPPPGLEPPPEMDGFPPPPPGMEPPPEGQEQHPHPPRPDVEGGSDPAI